MSHSIAEGIAMVREGIIKDIKNNLQAHKQEKEYRKLLDKLRTLVPPPYYELLEYTAEYDIFPWEIADGVKQVEGWKNSQPEATEVAWKFVKARWGEEGLKQVKYAYDNPDKRPVNKEVQKPQSKPKEWRKNIDTDEWEYAEVYDESVNESMQIATALANADWKWIADTPFDAAVKYYPNGIWAIFRTRRDDGEQSSFNVDIWRLDKKTTTLKATSVQEAKSKADDFVFDNTDRYSVKMGK